MLVRRLFPLLVLVGTALRVGAESRSDLRLRVAGDLLPGTSRAAVLARLGQPERQDSTHIGYALDDGWVTLAFDSHGIREAIRTRNRSQETDWLYSRLGPPADTAERLRRQTLLTRRGVADLRQWGRSCVRTAARPGLLFELPHGIARVEELCPLPCEFRHYADAVASVTVSRPGGPDRVVYRAWDHWSRLRPPGLTDAALKRRIAGFRSAGAPRIPVSASVVLGPADAEMGSGIGYRLYWIPDGLLIASGAGACVTIKLSQPGAQNTVGFAAWLRGERPH